MSRFEVGNRGRVCEHQCAGSGVTWRASSFWVSTGSPSIGLCHVDLGRGPPILLPHTIPQLTSKPGVALCSLWVPVILAAFALQLTAGSHNQWPWPVKPGIYFLIFYGKSWLTLL